MAETKKKAARLKDKALYSRAQAADSQKYRPYRDVVFVALQENEMYTAEEIQERIDAFLKRPIKEQMNGKGK